MRASKEMTELLKKHMFYKESFRRVELCWDTRIRFSASDVDSLLAKMHDMSLAYVVEDMATYCPFDNSRVMIIYLQPSIDGQTNIDVGFMEELGKIVLKSSNNTRDETFRRTHQPCS